MHVYEPVYSDLWCGHGGRRNRCVKSRYSPGEQDSLRPREPHVGPIRPQGTQGTHLAPVGPTRPQRTPCGPHQAPGNPMWAPPGPRGPSMSLWTPPGPRGLSCPCGPQLVHETSSPPFGPSLSLRAPHGHLWPHLTPCMDQTLSLCTPYCPFGPHAMDFLMQWNSPYNNLYIIQRR